MSKTEKRKLPRKPSWHHTVHGLVATTTKGNRGPQRLATDTNKVEGSTFRHGNGETRTLSQLVGHKKTEKDAARHHRGLILTRLRAQKCQPPTSPTFSTGQR